jgi:integrase
LGLRPSEAIGLRYRHIDWRSRTITVCESLSRGSDGKSAGYAREQRQRKTGNSTVLDLPDDLYALFQGRFTSACKPEDLIFTSATGKAIDDHNFSQRVWKTVLKEAGIDYRPPYNLRHSMASHAIAQGATLPEVAYLLGHKNTRMVSEVYGHTINRPQVPKLEL